MVVMSILANSTSMPAASSVVASILTLWETRAGKMKEDGLDELWGTASPMMLHGLRDWEYRVLLEGGDSWAPRRWDDGYQTFRHGAFQQAWDLGRQEKNS